MWLVLESFYRKESFDGAHLVCEWNISVPLQQMHIQGKTQGPLDKHIFWILKVKGPQCDLCHDVPTYKTVIAKDMEILHGMDNWLNLKS